MFFEFLSTMLVNTYEYKNSVNNVGLALILKETDIGCSY